MNLLGIIAEYNPFHNGHKYHLNISKQKSCATHTMAIMSGNFLQRGEPALIDKWTRANTAVQNGVDLVVELPFVYSCQSAEIFAYGAVKILDILGIVNTISFGCEDDDLQTLSEIAKLLILEPNGYKLLLKKYLSNGYSYPKARQFAIDEYLSSSNGMMNSPNNILAIEYLKWLFQFRSNITPLPIKRVHAGYHEQKAVNNFAGATYIRNLLLKTGDPQSIFDLVPKPTYEQVCNYSKTTTFNQLNHYFTLVMSNILKTPAAELSEIFDVNEGLENRIIRAVSSSKDMEELLENIVSKRITKTRVKRILMNLLLDHNRISHYKFFKNDDFMPYLRVLAFNEKGKEILKEIKKSSEVNIITNVGKDYEKLNPSQRYCIDKDILATNYYYLMTDLEKINRDWLKKPEII